MASPPKHLSQATLMSLPPESEDFVVIGRSSSSSSQDAPSPSPQGDSTATPSAYQMSLIDQAASPETDVQQLSRKIDSVSQRNSSMRRSLSDSCVSLERLRGQVETMRRSLAEKDQALAGKSELCEKQQAEIQKLREAVARLTCREEEWEQTRQDYCKLKNEYGLLSNTKVRLEQEKADLLQSKADAVAAEVKQLRAGLEQELRDALEKQRQELEADKASCLDELKAKHRNAVEAMEGLSQARVQQLTDHLADAAKDLEAAQVTHQADLSHARSASEQELNGERERFSAQLTALIASHQTALAEMRAEHEARILHQEQILTESRRQLAESESQHAAEKSELLDQVTQLSGRSLQCGHDRTNRSLYVDESIGPDAEFSMYGCSCCGGVNHVLERAVGQRPGHQERGTDSMPERETHDVGVMTSSCVSVAASTVTSCEAASVDLAMAAMTSTLTTSAADQAARDTQTEQATIDASEQTVVGVTQTSQEGQIGHDASEQTVRVIQTSQESQMGQQTGDASEQTVRVTQASQECQTEQLDFQIANSASLQDGSVRNLQMQVAVLSKTLRDDRVAKEQIEVEHKRLLRECQDLRGQLTTNQSVASSATCANERLIVHLEQAKLDLLKQLESKQAELGSLVGDLDETRNRLYELMEQVKRDQCRFSDNDTQAEKLRQKIRELEGQLQEDRGHHEMELESARTEGQFKDTKLQAAEREAELQRQEVQRLKAVEDDLNRRCRENHETVQQIVANSEQDKVRFGEELQKLRSENTAQTEVLQANAKVMEQKANEQLQLKDAIRDLVERLRLKAEEQDRKLTEASRKQEQLYHRMCDQSEQRMKAEQQLKLAHGKLADAEKQLSETKARLGDSERFASEMQTYSSNLEAEFEKVKQQFKESAKKRDDVMNVAEQLQARFQEELQRSAGLETELSRLKLDCSKLMTDLRMTQENASLLLEKEHELQTQLEQCQRRLRQAEEAIDVYKYNSQATQMELNASRTEGEKLRVERDDLRVRVNLLIENLTQREQQQPQEPIYDDLLDRHRRPGGNR